MEKKHFWNQGLFMLSILLYSKLHIIPFHLILNTFALPYCTTNNEHINPIKDTDMFKITVIVNRTSFKKLSSILHNVHFSYTWLAFPQKLTCFGEWF